MKLPTRVSLLALALCALPLGLPSRSSGQDLQTTAERTAFSQTATHEQVMAFCETLAEESPLVTLGTLGETNEGRTLPMLIVADPPVASAEEARASGKLVALLLGNIHAGEVCGKEALLMLARELGAEGDHPLLEDFVICIVPIYNADGNERMAEGNRPGQVGPERMGVRPNAQGLDLNRDFIKAEAPETRALLRAFRNWDPHVFIDTHTTNGSHHRYVLTYSGPKHPGGDVELLEYVRDAMLPRVGDSLRDEHGHETFAYGNFADDHTRWTTFPAAPRYSTNYVGMRNRIGILSEAYSYATFEERVIATRDFCRAVLEDVAAHRDEITALLDAADERASSGSTRTDPTPIRTTPVALDEPATAMGFVEVEEDGRMISTDAPKDYEVEVLDNFIARDEVQRPWGYIIPSEREDIATLLQTHGIEVEVIREDVELDAEVSTIENAEQAPRAFQGHRMVTVETSVNAEPRTIEAGAYLARVDQALGNLVVAMLEPRAEDSLVTWNFFDEQLEEGTEHAVLRVPERTPLLTAPLPTLEEDRETGKRITYDVLNGRDRPRLGGSPMRSVEWRDDEHYIVSRGGERWLVEAATGRYLEQVEGEDRSAINAAIKTLPGIDAKAAGRARISSRRGGIGLFSHAEDIYAVALDGSWARRLTATPGAEELATLSPDGQYAAFVREHDLYTVETATGIEIRLTTNGSENIRNGKHAWIYYEEIYGRNWRAYWWSPDSSSIAFYETDSTKVDRFTIVDDAVEPQEVRVTEYPKPGSPNPDVRLGIANASGGEPRFVDLSGYTDGSFIVSSVRWWPDSSKLCYSVQDRSQTWLDLCTTPRSGGEPQRLLRDSTEAWITAPAYFQHLDDGTFLLSSERSGWQHLYRYSGEGELLNQVTEGDWEFRGVVRLDQERGEIFFNCTADSPIGSSVYAVNLDGSNLRRITSERGTHRVSISTDGSYVADFWSNADQPDRAVLRDRDGKTLRTLDTNPVFELDEWDLGRMELLRVPASRSTKDDPVALEVQLIYPPDFDPGKVYPVWFMTYAGPHAPTVRDTWSGGRTQDQMLAASGFIVCRSEPYSASGKGARSAWVAYRKLGTEEMKDIDDLMNWIKAKPYVDASRIGMSGFSYGGFMTAFAMTHSEHFAAGIAGGSVTSWNDYDTIYTERYMGTPQDNPDGYAGTSVVAAAKNLHGNLLLVHGMLDDNVHMQNSVKFIRALQDADKDFEAMFYPRFAHGIWSKHYRRSMYEFQMQLIEQAADSQAPSEADEATEPARRDRARGRRRNSRDEQAPATAPSSRP
ncbi:MAG: DPP IV N-terminal domain-containing protein [Planctomycetota bacterium]|nr:DPP IV N-terminal domain-containing protein [Planctomycetota bacterium]